MIFFGFLSSLSRSSHKRKQGGSRVYQNRETRRVKGVTKPNLEGELRLQKSISHPKGGDKNILRREANRKEGG